MKFVKLNQHPEMIETIATWWFNEWFRLYPEDTTQEMATQSLRDKLDLGEPLPHILVAIENGKPIGTASLKLHELKNHFPDTQNWLGSVYTDNPARGAGLASQLVKEIENVARSKEISTLHLQTERLDGGLYKRLGWQTVTQLYDRGGDVLVMNKTIIGT